MDLARRYAFNLPWRGVVLGTAFYTGLSGYLARLASDYEGVIYLFLIGLSVTFALLAFIVMTRRLVSPRVLELAEDAVLFPHGFPRTRITRIPYENIFRMTESSVYGQASFTMVTTDGSFGIAAVRLPDIETYHVVRDFICSQASVVMPCYDERESSAERTWEKFPDPILHWVESEDWPRYRRHLVVLKPLLPRLVKALWFFVRCFGVFFIPWLLLRFFGLTNELAPFLCSSIFGTLLITCFYHWIPTAYPARATEITFRDNRITHKISENQTYDLNYRDLSGWAVVERQFEGRVLSILLLKWRASRNIEMALPDTSTRDRLVQLLRDKQIPQSPDLKPSWE